MSTVTIAAGMVGLTAVYIFLDEIIRRHVKTPVDNRRIVSEEEVSELEAELEAKRRRMKVLRNKVHNGAATEAEANEWKRYLKANELYTCSKWGDDSPECAAAKLGEVMYSMN